MELINDLKKEKTIFFKYCKRYKLFKFFLIIFSMLLVVKSILQLFGTDLNAFLNNWYNIFLGLSMSALFYYWIEYKKTYINIGKNKKKVLTMLGKIESMLEKSYYNNGHYEIKWRDYLGIFDYLEYIIEITYKFNWFETSYVESMMWIQIQENYTYFKRKRCKILELEKEGERLSIKEGSDLDGKLSQSIEFKEIKKDIIKNEKLKRRLCISDEMQRKIEEVTGNKVQMGGGHNFYYRYCEEEILIIKCLLVVIDDIRKVVRKSKI